MRFRVSATDLVDAAIVPVCSPASSTLFRIGVTRVDCTATIAGRTSPVPRSPSASSWCGKRGRSALLTRRRRGRLDCSSAELATRGEGHVLQRPALPGRSPDPERLAEPAAAPAARRVDAPRTTNASEPGKVRLVRLAGLRRSCPRRLRQFARPEHLPRQIKRPRSRGAFRNVIRRRPTLPGGCPPSTIGAGGLNFSVRNGKRCTPAAMTAENCQGLALIAHPQNSIAADTCSKSRPRAISTGPLNGLLRLHVPPINVVVSHGSYSLKGMGSLISRWASRLDAFSGYPIQT